MQGQVGMVLARRATKWFLKKCIDAHFYRGMSLTELEKKYGIIDVPTPPNVRLSGKYKRSGGYKVMQDYLPTTLDQIVYNLIEHKNEVIAQYGERAGTELINVLGLIVELKHNLVTGKPLELFVGKEPDKDTWNTCIQSLAPEENTYYKGSWLFVECYMYRKIVEFFERTEKLYDYDPHFELKKSALLASANYIKEVAGIITTAKRDEKWFSNLLKLNLWSNRCDMTLTDGKVIELTGKPFENVTRWEQNLLINHTKEVWDTLNEANNRCDVVIVDVISDNSGYELFNDLLTAGYMVDFKLANIVRFNVKEIPWFISDTTFHDFDWALHYLENFQDENVCNLGKKFLTYMKEGKFILAQPEHFWTSPFEFHKMKEVVPKLYERLAESTLIIVKGDLNHRKLIGDFNRDYTEKFETRLENFRPSNIVTLRSIKSEVISGLCPAVAENLGKNEPFWMNTGKYGIIQFAPNVEC